MKEMILCFSYNVKEAFTLNANYLNYYSDQRLDSQTGSIA